MTDLRGQFIGLRFCNPMNGAAHGPMVASMVLMAGSTILGAAGAAQGGKAQKLAANFQAAQLEAAGKVDNAVAQRKAEEDRRQTRLVQSRARAVGAASGGGIDFDLAGDIEAEGEYSALTSLWEGVEASKGRKAQAAAARFEGLQARKSGLLKAGKTILSGASSMFGKYG